MRKLLQPAMVLNELYQTLSTEPLENPAEFHAFYEEQINRVRGSDKIAHIRLGLNNAVLV